MPLSGDGDGYSLVKSYWKSWL